MVSGSEVPNIFENGLKLLTLNLQKHKCGIFSECVKTRNDD